MQTTLRRRAACCTLDNQIQPFEINRLFQKIIGAQTQRSHRIGDTAVAGEEDPLAAGLLTTDLFEQIQCVAVRQAHIRKYHERDQTLVKQLTAGRPERVHQHHAPSFTFKVAPEFRPEHSLVFYDQQSSSHRSDCTVT